MKWVRAAGLVLGLALLYALTLSLVRYFAPAIPPPFGLFAALPAAGLPAFFAAPLAYRWKLPQPLVWVGIGYCLGSGIATAALLGGGEAPARYLETALVHALSLTVLAPATDGGYLPLWGNLLWLAVAVVLGSYGLDAYRGGRQEPRQL